MLRIVHIEDIAKNLSLLTELVRLQQENSLSFVQQVYKWLDSLEHAFTVARLYQAGSIALLRSQLVAVEQGKIPSEIQFRGQPSRSRIISAVAADILKQASDLASALILENRSRIVDAERVAQQVIAVALSRGAIPPRDNAISNTAFLKILRCEIGLNSDLEQAVVHLEGLVGPHDALICLDRALASFSQY
jgi:hypothetical protein